jgi:Haem-binding uptake, Tiki superfamily, ChaN
VKWWFLLPAVALTSGCGSFAKPPLPKFALGEAPRRATEQDPNAARLRAAEVIYFGLTKNAESRPAWRVVETLQRGGQRVALGWSEVPVTQQPLLDRWEAQEISAPDLLDQLALAARGEWLRQALRPDLRQVALGSPRGLLRKIRAGDALSSSERAFLPQGYRPSAEGFDNFVDRVATSPRLRRYNLPRLYRAHLAAEQMIAENIVRFRRDHPDLKLLVFLPDDIMIDPREVADYVAQKETVRQMILDRSGAQPETRPQLLAAAARSGRALQIVDRAPETARHHRRLVAPRLRA